MEVPDNEWRASMTGWECRKRGTENEWKVKQRAGTLAIGVGTPKNDSKLICAQHKKKKIRWTVWREIRTQGSHGTVPNSPDHLGST